MLSKIKNWMKERGVLYELVLYQTVHTGTTLYGIKVPFWTSYEERMNLVADDAVRNVPFEPTYADIKDMRLGLTARIIEHNDLCSI